MNDVAERTRREKDHFNEGLERKGYNALFTHTRHYSDRHQRQVRKDILQEAHGKTVLEIGSTEWFNWLDRDDIAPSSVDCINISEKELQVGVVLCEQSKLKPNFHIMDAHDLQFPDDHFDVVIGNAVLHHLDLPTALDEIFRVLKPNGLMVFREPININPVAKIVRLATPRARTPDEQPFRFKDFREIEKRFDAEYSFEQFSSVPLGVLSRFIFGKQDNFLTLSAFKLDRALLRLVPKCGYLYRVVMVMGRKKSSGQLRSS